ncbi:DUF3667 domain-containing protein [Christiangramia sabulilitoris]|uniref:DUF3667 domain-containing protein n=1 Tax=Christiangramia sabulilitoris TaxID=2583991 RepID=A0A550I0K1_9FLAO|nr:DUF3667 domain-containing protein [Christiangramia sabulilitoris]TRO64506.1 DUF3667 domain-containing protein [Christiangramia sabulilitoris]
MHNENIPSGQRGSHLSGRIDRNYILQELKALLNLEKGYLFTIKSLILNPGESLRKYLSGDRSQLTKPLIFLLFNSFLAVFLSGYLNLPVTNHDAIEYSYYLNPSLDLQEIIRWKKSNMGYVYLFFGIFMAFWIRLFYRNYKYNIYEIFVVMAYILGQGMLIYILNLLGNHFLPAGIFKNIVLVFLGLGYYFYVVLVLLQLFHRKKIQNFFKLMLIFLLSGISFLSVQILVVVCFDLLGWL